jgi:hypothetical protein
MTLLAVRPSSLPTPLSAPVLPPRSTPEPRSSDRATEWGFWFYLLMVAASILYFLLLPFVF